MTDEELIAMARLAQRDERMSTGALYGHLADRMEELRYVINFQNKRAEKLTEGWLICDDSRIEAEAKLAENEVRLRKAVEALDMLVRDCEADYPPSHGAIKHFAIATLAEISSEAALIKGESREVPDR